MQNMDRINQDWMEKEYKRLSEEKRTKELERIKYINEVVIINGEKHIKRKDLTQIYEDNIELKIENHEIPLGVGKDFHKEWNRDNDKWSK